MYDVDDKNNMIKYSEESIRKLTKQISKSMDGLNNKIIADMIAESPKSINNNMTSGVAKKITEKIRGISSRGSAAKSGDGAAAKPEPESNSGDDDDLAGQKGIFNKVVTEFTDSINEAKKNLESGNEAIDNKAIKEDLDKLEEIHGKLLYKFNNITTSGRNLSSEEEKELEEINKKRDDAIELYDSIATAAATAAAAATGAAAAATGAAAPLADSDGGPGEGGGKIKRNHSFKLNNKARRRKKEKKKQKTKYTINNNINNRKKGYSLKKK
jgi:hypothetical protein